MKLYLLFLVVILGVIILGGFVLPWLFSASSDLAVGLGVVIMCTFPVSIYFMISKVIKVMTKNKNGDEE
jgi:hypothetical protein